MAIKSLRLSCFTRKQNIVFKLQLKIHMVFSVISASLRPLRKLPIYDTSPTLKTGTESA